MTLRVLNPRVVNGALTGRHVLISFVGFFAVIFAVNGVLLYKALSTHSGLVAQEPYRKGLQYNARIEAGERQQELGWVDTVSLSASGEIVVALANASGRPVSGLVLTAVVGRPSTVQHDHKLTLAEGAPGRYVANAGPLESGAWLLSVEARDAAADTAADPTFRLKRRLWLKP